MRPKVTVGVCVRNCEDYVKEAVESILDQDFPHELMELIFVDDGSEDNTLSVIQDYASKIDIPAKIFSGSWRGLGHVRNTVVANAEGDFILWVDGDMVIARDFVKKLVKFMDKHPEVGIAKGKQALEPGGNLLATLETYSRAAGRMVDYTSEKAHSKSMGTGGCIYRAKAIREVDGFDENIRGYGEDLDAEFRIREAGWLLCTTDVQFRDYERGRILWKDLWCRYLQRGYDLYLFSHKKRGVINFYKMLPPAAFIAGLFYSVKIYRLTNRKIAFLLPLQCMLKMTALCLGFMRSNMDSYKNPISRSSID